MLTLNKYSLEYLETPEKSLNDKKDYKCLVLPNGLKLLLISDYQSSSNFNNDDRTTENSLKSSQSDEKLSAVALMVDVGSFSEPREYQGLAHFLEHMIFMGSKKYPIENSFDKHTTKYGGFNNACTNCEKTLFFFEVPEKHLDTTMDCFAAQMKEPLLLKESMTREREAIESEYQLVVNNDDVRHDQLVHSLANENYPHNSFTWGNLKSLKEDIDSDEKLNSSLFSFYNRHYSAHRMYACLQSNLPLGDLEELAIKHFADIRSNYLMGHDFSQYNYKKAFRPEFYDEVFFVKPIENVCRLDLTWVLPCNLKFYKCKPANFLSYLWGYEGEGSLCAYLRKRLWAVEVMAGPETNPIFTFFTLFITLTELGFKHLDKVLTATFAYIKLFNKTSELQEVYEELSFIESSNFRFAAEISPSENVQSLVKCLKYYPPKDILTGDHLYFEYNEEQVQQCINHLTEFNFNMMLTSQQCFEGVVYDKKEKWFGTEYTSRKIPAKWLELWHNSPKIEELYMAKANRFIARDFRIFWLENNKKDLMMAPEKLMQTETFELWFRQDDKFLLPHGYMYFNMTSPLLKHSAKNIVLCSLYLDLVQHHLVEELYPATMAGISYQIYYAENGVVLMVDGYNEKLPLVVEIIMKGLISTQECINESELEIFKKQQQKNYFNSLIKPDTVNKDLNTFVLKDIHWLMTEKFKYISHISLEDVKRFASEFSKELYVQALIQGNLQQDTAHIVMSTVMDHLNCSPIKQISLMEKRGTELPLGTHKILCHNLNPKDCNTIVTNVYQIGPRSLRKECILDLLIMILETPVYDVLRTQQQLGYYVSCCSQIFYGIMTYSIYVSSQETKHSAFCVEQRMEEFRCGVRQLLQEMSLEDFENFKSSLIKLKEIKDLSLYEEVGRNWSEIINEHYMFERKRQEIQILHTLEKQDILEFWLNNDNENMRKLSVQVIGVKNMDEKKEMPEECMYENLFIEFLDSDQDGSSKAILNIEEFKQGLKVYPVIKTEVFEN